MEKRDNMLENLLVLLNSAASLGLGPQAGDLGKTKEKEQMVRAHTDSKMPGFGKGIRRGYVFLILSAFFTKQDMWVNIPLTFNLTRGDQHPLRDSLFRSGHGPYHQLYLIWIFHQALINSRRNTYADSLLLLLAVLIFTSFP